MANIAPIDVDINIKKTIKSIQLTPTQIHQLYTNQKRILVQCGEIVQYGNDDYVIWNIPQLVYCKLGDNNSLIICDKHQQSIMPPFEHFNQKLQCYQQYQDSDYLLRIVSIKNMSVPTTTSCL